MADDLGVAGRMKEARFRTAANRQEAISQGMMAELVTSAGKRVIHQTQWGRYETGESEPPLDVIEATEKVSGLSRSYLAFGVDVNALINPATDRKLTTEEEQRATAAAGRERAKKKASGRKQGRRGAR